MIPLILFSVLLLQSAPSLASSCENSTLATCVQSQECFWCLDDSTCRITDDPYCKDHLYPSKSSNCGKEKTYKILFIVFLILFAIVSIVACVGFCKISDRILHIWD